ncbi:STYKc [Aspergillus sclerotialis]|uniref:STYKc n=1 Tax=Aspergillus sclerotialis TaxID=2070753 RepID=A0A3A2ZLN8_9EURO|nr:STYKc [Aspergillus sclerotialis]
MKNGELRSYLESHTASRTLQLLWFCQMAHTLAHIHERHVLVTDISTRNFLLDDNMSLKLCDFSEASVLPLQTNTETADDEGYTVAVDIGLLGVIMYEIVTGTRCEIDLYKDNDPRDGRAYWPDRSYLSSTENLWLGPIIEACWTGGFQDARSLLEALETAEEQPPFIKTQFQFSFIRSTWRRIQERSIMSMAICRLIFCMRMRNHL